LKSSDGNLTFEPGILALIPIGIVRFAKDIGYKEQMQFAFFTIPVKPNITEIEEEKNHESD